MTVNDFYGPSYLKWVFAQDYWYYNFYLPQVSLATLPTSPFNETHFDNPHYNPLYEEAFATIDDAKRQDSDHEMQEIDYNEGGLHHPVLPAGHRWLRPRTCTGLVPSKGGLSLNAYDFKRLWLS